MLWTLHVREIMLLRKKMYNSVGANQKRTRSSVHNISSTSFNVIKFNLFCIKKGSHIHGEIDDVIVKEDDHHHRRRDPTHVNC